MKNLHHKSVLECQQEKDIERHLEESQGIIRVLEDFAKFGVLVCVQYKDYAHRKKSAKCHVFSSGECMKVLDELDCKNGYDFGIDKGQVVITVFGSVYEMKGFLSKFLPFKKIECMQETLCSFKFVKSKEKLDLLLEMDQEALHYAYIDESFFLEQEELLENLYMIKKRDLTTIIKDAEEKLQLEESEEQKIK